MTPERSLMFNYIEFIENQLQKQNRSPASVSEAAAGNPDLIRNWQRGSSPSLKKYENVLAELGCRIEIVTPDNMALPEEAYTQIPLLGVAEAGAIDEFDPIEFDDESMRVPRPFAGHAGIKIKGDSMYPVYEDGDVVLIVPSEHTDPRQVIGRDAICELQDGNALLKRVSNGKDGTFNLSSIHPSYPPIHNAHVRKFHRVVACLKQPRF